MDSNLVVIGLSHRTAPVEVRERFWISDSRLFDALHQLVYAQGIDEVVLLATCNRTEFVLWAENAQAADSVVRQYLERVSKLRPSEWESFYRYVGEAALAHVFRVASSLDSMVVGEAEVTGQLKAAWAKAQQAGTSGRFLDTVFQRALSISKRVRNETSISVAAVSVPYAAVELARQIFGPLTGCKVLILGAGKMGELSARYLANRGASALWVVNRTYEHAVSLARKLDGVALRFEELWDRLAEADIVITSTGCPHVIITQQDAQRMRRQRQGRPMFFVDIAVPRDVDPGVRDVSGMFLYDIDDLQQVVARNLGERQAAAAEAERLVASEARDFARKLAAERVVPTIVAIRQRLEELRQQELARYRAEAGPLSPAEERALESLTTQLVHRIATQLARELKQLPERSEQEHLAAAVRRLFGLTSRAAEAKPTGTSLCKTPMTDPA